MSVVSAHSGCGHFTQWVWSVHVVGVVSAHSGCGHCTHSECGHCIMGVVSVVTLMLVVTVLILHFVRFENAISIYAHHLYSMGYHR